MLIFALKHLKRAMLVQTLSFAERLLSERSSQPLNPQVDIDRKQADKYMSPIEPV